MKLLLLSVVLLFALATLALATPANVGDNFQGTDFDNFSYPYRFSWGKNIRVALKNGKYEYDLPIGRGWFTLKGTYVRDITGDNRPEAIVVLWHISCGASCDGGAALIYIYSFSNRRLKQLWQYETGSLAYGCGLKSFTARRTELRLELFARCSKTNRALNETSSTGKFQVAGVTRVTFSSNGTRFIARKRQFFSSAERSVKNYEPEIKIEP